MSKYNILEKFQNFFSSIFISDNDEIKEEQENSEILEKIKNSNKDIVIDASITYIPSIGKQLDAILTGSRKIILTDITIMKLDKIKRFIDFSAFNALHILNLAAEDMKSKFLAVTIDKSAGSPDDCIISYCRENQDKVILLTADKIMANNAHLHNVETIFLDNLTNINTSLKKRIVTLRFLKKVGNKLLISDFNKKSSDIMLISNGIYYENCSYINLSIGDHIFISSIKDDCITFADYEIINLTAKDHASLVYSRRLHNKKDIEQLSKLSYKIFIKDFIYKQGL